MICITSDQSHEVTLLYLHHKMKQQSTRLYVESNLYFESNRKKASSCCCSFVLVTLVFLFVANLTQDLASASTAVVEDSEDPTEYGMQAWFAYCADHDTSNDTLIKNMTSCQLTSANLKEELMSDCMKKFFPADIYGSGLSKIKKAQCGLSMGSFEKKKISEV